MKFTQEKSQDGVTERLFELTVAGDLVPGVIWAPEGARGPRPLLLIGHGGGQHKLFASLAASAQAYARELHYAVVAIDAPYHGARTTPEERARFSDTFRQNMEAGGLGGEALKIMTRSAAQALPEWRAVLDAVQSLDFVGAGGPIGYIGLSQGAVTGIPLVASEPRITAAIFGMAGLHPETPLFEEAARQLTVPVEFLAQWDDELVPRATALALFDAIGSAEKTLHANPGGHRGVPPFERLGWTRFFMRHLGGIGAAS